MNNTKVAYDTNFKFTVINEYLYNEHARDLRTHITYIRITITILYVPNFDIFL